MFYSVPCSSWENFTDNNCESQSNGIEALMGIDSDPRLTGNYYLQTNGEDPYDQGEDGMIYKPIEEPTTAN